jgi:hypothetical protein
VLPLLLVIALTQAGPPRAPWHVEVTTHGGLSGRGAGAVRIRSGGDAELFAPDGQRCALRLEARELRRLDDAVRRAAPDRWRPRYFLPDNPTGCCDQVATTLALTRGNGRSRRPAVTGWYDESRARVPADAVALHDAALDVLLAHAGCGGAVSAR